MSDLIINVSFRCAHCGREKRRPVAFSSGYESNYVYQCDSDEGGCDERTVFDIDLVASVVGFRVDSRNNPMKKEEERR